MINSMKPVAAALSGKNGNGSNPSLKPQNKNSI
jgi:hypothetical protein